MSLKITEQDGLELQFRLGSINPKPIVRRGKKSDDGDDPDDDGDNDQEQSEDGDESADGRKKRKKKRGTSDEVAQADEENAADGDGPELAPDDEVRSYGVAVSSEQPVDRWFGNEVLSHAPDAVDMSRANGMPVLLDHDPSRQIGVMDSLSLGKDKVLRGQMRFSRNPDAQAVEQDVRDGIRKNISVGYRVNRYDVQQGTGNVPDEYRATSWTPHEVSIVSIPADHTVGVGRSHDGRKYPLTLRTINASPEQGQERAAMPATTAQNGQKEIAEIVRLANQHGMSQRAAEWIEAGKTVAEVSQEILAARGSKPMPQPAPESVDLDQRDRKQYSYARAVLAAADRALGNRAAGCLELEVSDAIEKHMPNSYQARGGVYIPTSLRAAGVTDGFGADMGANPFNQRQRAAIDLALRAGTIDSQTANAIKEVVFTQYGGELINILRNTAMTVAMGSRVLTGLSSPVGFPRQTGDVTAQWVAENSGSDVPATNVTTNLVTLTPKTLMAATSYSRQLLVQSSVDVEAMVRESIAAKHALAWDLAAIHGTGLNNQPTGIYNQVGVQSHAFSTNSVTYTDLLAMEKLVAVANAMLGSLGWLTNPRIASAAKGTLEFPNVNGARKIWEGTILEGEVDGYVARATNQVSNALGVGGNESGLIFGNWSDLLIGQFGGAMEIIVDPYTLKKQGLIELASFQMADIAVRHPVSFAVSSGIIVS